MGETEPQRLANVERQAAVRWRHEAETRPFARNERPAPAEGAGLVASRCRWRTCRLHSAEALDAAPRAQRADALGEVARREVAAARLVFQWRLYLPANLLWQRAAGIGTAASRYVHPAPGVTAPNDALPILLHLPGVDPV